MNRLNNRLLKQVDSITAEADVKEPLSGGGCRQMTFFVIQVKDEIHNLLKLLDSRLRGNDGKMEFAH